MVDTSRSMDEWLAIHQLADQFEQQWQRGERPPIREFLAKSPIEREAVLIELVHLDLEYRIKLGETVRAEAYFNEYPELHGSNAVVELLATEYRFRRRGEPGLSIDEFVDRFPKVGLEVRARLEEVQTEDPKEHHPPSSTETPYGTPRMGGQEPLVVLGDGVGRYECLDHAGRGSFGTVYRGYDPQLERIVAIKVPREGRLVTVEQCARFDEEAKRAASVTHPGIVQVYDVGRSGPIPFIVTEYVEGSSLAERIREERLPHHVAARIVAEVAEALACAHEEGLIHRDVKPGNLLLDENDHVRLADFGLAIWHEHLEEGVISQVGTPAYMSPEQVRFEGHRIDGRSDVFSLGVVFYELLCGQRPFNGDDLREQILHADPPLPVEVDNTVPRELQRICLRALSKKIVHRYPSAGAMARDLRLALSSDLMQSDEAASTAPPRSAGLRAYDANDAESFIELLPGPWDRNGIPLSVRFWLDAIETTGEPFPVGLLHGPSGCGKSSLVRAGVIPRLSDSVTTVYVEASASETETRLREQLDAVSDIPGEGSSIADTLRGIRVGQGLPRNRKLLIILDQFELWLASRSRDHATPLVDALRQADGHRVQVLLMIRDEFWSSIVKLFHELDLHPLDGQNDQLVDLFDREHAIHVLKVLGRSLGCLPHGNLEPKQERCVELAVDQLCTRHATTAVRLSLFVELFSHRPWTPESIESIGGLEGIGATYLWDTFESPRAQPEYRAVAKSARRILAELLPPAGNVVRGTAQSRASLAVACVQDERSAEFSRVIEILDRELRLVVPTDEPPGSPQTESSDRSYYQLTHDSMIAPIRQWVKDHEQSTWRGRARQRLLELTPRWQRSRSRSDLPSMPEFVRIALAVRGDDRSPAERRLMRAAGRHHSITAAITFAVACLVGWGGWALDTERKARRAERRLERDVRMAGDIARKVVTVDHDAFASVVLERLPMFRQWANATLEQIEEDEEGRYDSHSRLRASLALLPVDQHQAEKIARRVVAGTEEDLQLFHKLMKHRQSSTDASRRELTEDFLLAANDTDRPLQQRLFATIALTDVCDKKFDWDRIDNEAVAEALLESDSVYLGELLERLEPLKSQLVGQLQRRFHGLEQRVHKRMVVVRLLGYLNPSEEDDSQTAALVDCLINSTASEFRVLRRLLSLHRDSDDLRRRFMSVVDAPIEATLPPDERVKVKRRRAMAVMSLLHLDRTTSAISRFQEDADLGTLTQFIHRARDCELPAAMLVGRLLRELEQGPANDARGVIPYALLLALGDYPLVEISNADAVVAKLLEGYRNDPRSGVHSAIGWLLRQWGYHAKIEEADADLVSTEPDWERREWFVREPTPGVRVTLIVFQPDLEFQMGSPEDEVGRDPATEELKPAAVTRPFAIADRELKRSQFDKFADHIDANGGRLRNSAQYDDLSPQPESAMHGVAWREAQFLCIWLSHESGEGSCYQPGTAAMLDCDTSRTGFRLPLPREWEYACRAGTRTAFSFGNDRSLGHHYCWSVEAAKLAHRPVALLRPSLRGMFDMHGNLHEWCEALVVERANQAVVRGGSARSIIDHARAATNWRTDIKEGAGIRLVRTLPAGNESDG